MIGEDWFAYEKESVQKYEFGFVKGKIQVSRLQMHSRSLSS